MATLAALICITSENSCFISTNSIFEQAQTKAKCSDTDTTANHSNGNLEQECYPVHEEQLRHAVLSSDREKVDHVAKEPTLNCTNTTSSDDLSSPPPQIGSPSTKEDRDKEEEGEEINFNSDSSSQEQVIDNKEECASKKEKQEGGLYCSSRKTSHHDKVSLSKHHYCSYSDESSSMSSITSSVASTSPTKNSSKIVSQRYSSSKRFDELYRRGKEKRRAELKKFTKEKNAKKEIPLTSSKKLSTKIISEDSIRNSRKMLGLVKRNEEFALKRKKELARARARDKARQYTPGPTFDLRSLSSLHPKEDSPFESDTDNSTSRCSSLSSSSDSTIRSSKFSSASSDSSTTSFPKSNHRLNEKDHRKQKCPELKIFSDKKTITETKQTRRRCQSSSASTNKGRTQKLGSVTNRRPARGKNNKERQKDQKGSKMTKNIITDNDITTQGKDMCSINSRSDTPLKKERRRLQSKRNDSRRSQSSQRVKESTSDSKYHPFQQRDDVSAQERDEEKRSELILSPRSRLQMLLRKFDQIDNETGEEIKV
jgi:hypothetical protein